MNRNTTITQSEITWALGGIAFGALAMYLSDPDRGRRRRALATDKIRSAVTKTSDAIDVASRDLGHRVEGLRAQASRVLSREGGTSTEDRVLTARVRQKIGRAVRYSHAIDVVAHQGHVVLAGPVLADEKQQLLDTVRGVHGVNEIDDQLELHESADTISSLQGSRVSRMSAGQGNWTPALRALAVIGGSALGWYGMTRRTQASALLTTGGLALIASGVAGRALTSVASLSAGQQTIDLNKTIHIDAPPERVFDVWSKYENFPHFMSHVKEVRDLGNGRSHWVVSGPAGASIEWDSILTESRRPEVLAWRSEPDSTVQNQGTVRLQPDGNGTRVSVHMSYSPPAGLAGHAAASLLAADPKQQMDDDLMRMKSFIETGNVPRDAAQPGQPTPSTFH